METLTKSIMNIAALLLSFTLVMILFSCLYLWRHRRFYKMMRKLTGPPSLPIIGNLSTYFRQNSDFFHLLGRWAAENTNPMVIWNSLFMPLVVVFDPKNLQIVSNSSVQRDIIGTLKGFGTNGLLGASVERWRKLRPSHDQCFGSQHMVKYLDVFNAKFDKWTDRLKSFAISGEIVNIWDMTLVAHTEMMLENITGYNLKSLGLEASELAESQSMIMKLSSGKVSSMLLPRLFKFYLLCTGQNHFFKTAKKFTRTILEAKIRDISIGPTITPISDEEGRRPKNCLDSVFKIARKYPELANLNDMHEDLWSVSTSGIDTTAISICFLLLMLAVHQDVQQRVYEEIMSVFEKEDRPVQMKDLTKLKYLEQCLKETLRRFSIVPIVVRTMTSDTTLSNGSILPEGARVLMYLNPLHFNSRVYAHPDAWNPEHFAEENAGKYKTSFFPFGTGPRRCIGYKYAKVYAKTQIVYVLRKYRLTTNVTMGQIETARDFIVRSKNGYPIRFHFRNE